MNIMLMIIQNLQGVARRNGDRFVYRIEITPLGNKLRFRFICEESTDHHCLVSGEGSTMEEAATNAFNDIPDACRSWGYKL